MKEVNRDFPAEPDDCPHPESAIEKVRYLNQGALRNQCQKCGFNYHVYGDHEMVVVDGEYYDTADFYCADCGLEAGSFNLFFARPCRGDDE